MPKETAMQERLYRLAKRLNVGRILRYGDLWTRYLWPPASSLRAWTPWSMRG
jgi:hypothetical protein